MREYSKSECESVDTISPPPLEESWLRFEQKLLEQAKAEKQIIAL